MLVEKSCVQKFMFTDIVHYVENYKKYTFMIKNLRYSNSKDAPVKMYQMDREAWSAAVHGVMKSWA